MNINPIDITKLESELRSVYLYNTSCKNHEDKIVPALWGPPGIGKTEVVKQVTSAIGTEVSLPYMTRVLGLASLSPVDVGGFPYERDGYAYQAKPFYFPREDEYVNVFLDEINTAPQINQVAAYQLTLNFSIQHHVMPMQTLVTVAGNRAKDKGATHAMPKPLENRLTHYEVKTSSSSFLSYASKKQFHPDVIGFIAFSPGSLQKEKVEPEERAFPTPRSWGKVSLLLNAGIGTRANISGTIGLGEYTKFAAYVKMKGELPDIEEILNTGMLDTIPQKRDLQYTLIMSMASRLVNKYSSERAENFFKVYSQGEFSRDLKVVAVRYLEGSDKGKLIINNPRLQPYVMEALNGKV